MGSKLSKEIKSFWERDHNIKVKICGINSLEVAYESCLLGADALGFHLWKHGDFRSHLLEYKNIIRYLPTSVSIWLLTDIVDSEKLKEAITILGIDTIQFQGRVDNQKFHIILDKLKSLYVKKNIKIVKSISTQKGNFTEIMKIINGFINETDAFIIDSRWKGGSGVENNWNVCKEIVQTVPKPIIIAGGLNSSNIAKVIKLTHPYGIDVESGVEYIVGKYRGKIIKCKSIKKIEELIEKVRQKPPL